MKKFAGKKLLTVLFISAILISVLPLSNTGSVTANASSSSYSCTSEKLQKLINQYSGSYWSGSYNGAYMCKGFADMMFNALYGTGGVGPYNSGYHYYVPNPRGAREVGRYSNASRSEIVSLMKKAHSGDYIQWSRGYSQHSAIFVSCDEGGIYMFDCNYISRNKCGVHYVTFDKLARTNYGISLYASTTEAAAKERAAEEARAKAEAEAKAKAEAQAKAKAEAEAKARAEAAARLRFNDKSIEVDFGATKVLNLKGTKEILEWKSSDPSVAIVNDEGKVTGIGSGTATITVTAMDGSDASCNVVVKCTQYKVAIEAFLNGFEINAKAMNMSTLGESALLF